MKQKEKPSFLKFRIILSALVLIVLGIGLGFAWHVSRTIPDLSEIEKPQTDLSTQIFTADGKLIRNLYSEKHRLPVKLTEISPYVLNALIATEDIRFYSHSGVDPASILTVIYRNLFKGQRSGGSTITMQLARNLFDKVGMERSVIRKAKEMITAVVFERKYTKEEIITSYLNTVSFHGNTYGIENGARIYFNKHAKDLNIEEAAMLVGLLKATNIYNPVKNPERGQARRNTVIEQMHKYGFLERPEADSLRRLDVNISAYKMEDHNAGLAPYLTEAVRLEVKEWCKSRDLDIYTDGLRIYTTIDSRMQRYAEEAAKEHLSWLQGKFDEHIYKKEPWRTDTTILTLGMTMSARYNMLRRQKKTKEEIAKNFRIPIEMDLFSYDGSIDTVLSPWDSLKYYSRFLETGVISIDPSNGHIKAWVGSIDHKYFKYDHVKLGKRQVGSTFKPFVYTAAFDNGYSPCSRELNQPVFFYKEDGELHWAPKNSDGKVSGYMTLRRGLATSTNLITARLMKKIGAEVVCDYAKNMGIQTQLECVPSLALGTTDLSVYELTGAYCTFVNKGVWNEPKFITRIEDKNGNLLEEFSGERREAISKFTAYQMLNMLMGVVDEPGGTAGRLRFRYRFENQLGGKTGTTQNHADGWFMGVSPYLVTGVWTGCSDRRMRFRKLKYGQGASMALPIFGLYMKKVYADSSIGLPLDPFQIPRGFDMGLVDCSKYIDSEEYDEMDSMAVKPKSIMDFDD